MRAVRPYCHHGLTLLQPRDIVCSALPQKTEEKKRKNMEFEGLGTT